MKSNCQMRYLCLWNGCKPEENGGLSLNHIAKYVFNLRHHLSPISSFLHPILHRNPERITLWLSASDPFHLFPKMNDLIQQRYNLSSLLNCYRQREFVVLSPFTENEYTWEFSIEPVIVSAYHITRHNKSKNQIKQINYCITQREFMNKSFHSTYEE